MDTNGRYLKLYNEVMLLEISSHQKLILSFILSFRENGKACFISNNWLAKYLGLSDRQVRRYLTDLEHQKLIARTSCCKKRILNPGPACPIPWTKRKPVVGQNRPVTPDEFDHILRQMNN